MEYTKGLYYYLRTKSNSYYIRFDEVKYDKIYVTGLRHSQNEKMTECPTAIQLCSIMDVIEINEITERKAKNTQLELF